MPRKYVFALSSGVAMFVAVYLIDAFLARVGLHAETTYLDDALLAIFVAGLVFFLQWQHERELRRQQQCAVIIDTMNHHIRNALQVIVYRANLDGQSDQQLNDITRAVERIDWALREILPSINAADQARSGNSHGEPLPTHVDPH